MAALIEAEAIASRGCEMRRRHDPFRRYRRIRHKPWNTLLSIFCAMSHGYLVYDPISHLVYDFMVW